MDMILPGDALQSKIPCWRTSQGVPASLEFDMSQICQVALQMQTGILQISILEYHYNLPSIHECTVPRYTHCYK